MNREWKLTDQEIAKVIAMGVDINEAQEAKKKAWLEANPQREMNYTKGEWKKEGNKIKVFGRGTIAICPSPTDDEGVLEFVANAHLIAAAPEMYEALLVIKSWLGGKAVYVGWSKDTNNLIRTALAKAEGGK